MGEVHYGLTKEEQKSKIFRRSLFAVENIKKGEVFSERNVRAIRPANGLEPKYMGSVLGRKAKTDVKIGTPLTWGLIEDISLKD